MTLLSQFSDFVIPFYLWYYILAFTIALSLSLVSTGAAIQQKLHASFEVSKLNLGLFMITHFVIKQHYSLSMIDTNIWLTDQLTQ